MPDRLYYTAFAVQPSRLPAYAGDAGRQVKAYTSQVGGSEITDLASDSAGTIISYPLYTDETGSFGCYITGGTTVDDVVWFQVVGSTAPRFGVGASSGFLTRTVGDSTYTRTSTDPDGTPVYLSGS